MTSVAAATVVVQCSSPEPTPEPTPAPSVSSTTRPPAEPDPARPASIHPVTTAELGPTWRPGCPVPAERLRRIELPYRGFDGRTHRGELVVDEALAADVVDVFGELYRQRFPIERMRTVDRYPGADDETSMRDNNTSAFNCRALPSGRWSLHALGRAIDVNPLLNPYVSASELQPATAGPYLDRRRTDPGVLHPDDPAVGAFLRRGWRWGGNWRAPKDYQHFER